MSIQIGSIRTSIVDYAIREERIVQSHAGRHDTSRFLHISIDGEDDVRGYGEASATLIWSGESAESAQWLIQHQIAPKLSGTRIGHPEEALSLLDSVVFGNPFTKAAVDTALWDLWARSQGRSVLELIADRKPFQRIPSRASIGAYPVSKTVALAREFYQAGIGTLKFKVGTGLDDGARLKAVREELGTEVAFTVDANGAYGDLDSFIREVEKMLAYDVALVEQPAPRDRIQLMAKMRKSLPVPILADEGIFTEDDLEEALDCDAFDFLSIYPGKNGGFTRSLRMAKRAAGAGKTCTIGSNQETDMGQAAMAVLCAGLSAFDPVRVVGDLASSLYYTESSVKNPLPFVDGQLEVPAGVGFGVVPRIQPGGPDR